MLGIELDSASDDVTRLMELGVRLRAVVGDRPELDRYLEDITGEWQSLNSRCARRQDQLNTALVKATSFHDELMVFIF